MDAIDYEFYTNFKYMVDTWTLYGNLTFQMNTSVT